MNQLKDLPEHRQAPVLMAAINQIVPTLEGWCPTDKAMTMATLIYNKKFKTVVELGIFGGRSLIPMAMAVKVVGSGKVYGVDPWSKEAALEGKNDKENDEWWSTINLEDVYKNFLSRMFQAEVSKQCSILRMKSEEAVRFFDDNTVDLMHCDSNHSEKVSIMELDMWAQKVRVGGYWIMDDSDWATMKKAQEYILEKGFELRKDFHKWRVYEKVRQPA